MLSNSSLNLSNRKFEGITIESDSMNAVFWVNSNRDVFSRSYREEDDEEALKWAALEKLPTYDRLRKGILISASRGGGNEVDVDTHGFQERKSLLESVGIELPTIEVRFEYLNIETEALVGNSALPTFVNFSVNALEVITTCRGFLNYLHMLPSRKKPLTILKDINGVIEPSRMTLLLGPPSSGKTTFLLALAGKLDPNLKFSGSVTCNGHGMNEFIPQKTAAYISQHDIHIGEVTVRETLAFSARCEGVECLHEMLAELSRREKAANIKPDPDIDVFMKNSIERVTILEQAVFMEIDFRFMIFLVLQAAATEGQAASLILGLDICADTLVGDEMLRAPETYDLFDDIILLSDGQIVYQVPREDVLGFFEHMGFKCPERNVVADFLQEVTSRKDQKQYWAHKDQPYSFITVQEFAEAFNHMTWAEKLDKSFLPHLIKARATQLLWQPKVWFFKQYFLLLIVNQMASALFRFMAATGRNMIANTFGSFAVLILFALGGIVLSRAFEKPQAVIFDEPEPSDRLESSHRTNTGGRLIDNKFR
ncbi:hypothetical protein GH714_041735 [Hevea brasiliensis]|uniref:ABC transporter domain-containing protein n=1 Tax=Hevea brasiliensis TaxID=3981 RepID=A0A6A6MT92_HEVBR|nr:hypothetical protein GH714_041735 [Hevea brasiliensis]